MADVTVSVDLGSPKHPSPKKESNASNPFKKPMQKIQVSAKSLGNRDYSDFLTPSDGIFTINVRSEFDGFLAYPSITVQHSPSSSYVPPEHFSLVSSGTSINQQGAVVTKTFMPSAVLELNKVGVVSASSGGQSMPGGITISFADLVRLADDVFYPSKLFNNLAKMMGIDISASDHTSFSSVLQAFAGIVNITGGMMNVFRSTTRFTLKGFMQTVYSGLGLVAIVEGDTVKLTDNYTLVNSSSNEATIESSDVVAYNDLFDYAKTPKGAAIHIGPDGTITSKGPLSVDGDPILQLNRDAEANVYQNSLYSIKNPASSISNATGMYEEYQYNLPWLFKYLQVTSGIQVTGDSASVNIGDETIVIPVEKVEMLGLVMDGNPEDKMVSVNKASALVALKSLLFRSLQKIIATDMMLHSSTKTIVVDNVAPAALQRISVNGDKGSVIAAMMINASGASQVNIPINQGNIGGYCIASSATMREGGIVTTELTLIEIF